jgi:hypothetical protein
MAAPMHAELQAIDLDGDGGSWNHYLIHLMVWQSTQAATNRCLADALGLRWAVALFGVGDHHRQHGATNLMRTDTELAVAGSATADREDSTSEGRSEQACRFRRESPIASGMRSMQCSFGDEGGLGQSKREREQRDARALERLKARALAKVEPGFRVIKRRFGCAKVWYREERSAGADAVRAVEPVDVAPALDTDGGEQLAIPNRSTGVRASAREITNVWRIVQTFPKDEDVGDGHQCRSVPAGAVDERLHRAERRKMRRTC